MLSTLSVDVLDTIFLPIDLGVRYLFPLALCFKPPASVYLLVLAFSDKTLVLLMVWNIIVMLQMTTFPGVNWTNKYTAFYIDTFTVHVASVIEPSVTYLTWLYTSHGQIVPRTNSTQSFLHMRTNSTPSIWTRRQIVPHIFSHVQIDGVLFVRLCKNDGVLFVRYPMYTYMVVISVCTRIWL